jgi:hypothetical protein
MLNLRYEKVVLLFGMYLFVYFGPYDGFDLFYAMWSMLDELIQFLLF